MAAGAASTPKSLRRLGKQLTANLFQLQEQFLTHRGDFDSFFRQPVLKALQGMAQGAHQPRQRLGQLLKLLNERGHQ